MKICGPELARVEWEGRVCSTCRLLNDADVAFVPFDVRAELPPVVEAFAGALEA